MWCVVVVGSLLEITDPKRKDPPPLSTELPWEGRGVRMRVAGRDLRLVHKGRRGIEPRPDMLRSSGAASDV